MGTGAVGGTEIASQSDIGNVLVGGIELDARNVFGRDTRQRRWGGAARGGEKDRAVAATKYAVVVVLG